MPYSLSEAQKVKRVECCKKLFFQFGKCDERWLFEIATVDETWIYIERCPKTGASGINLLHDNASSQKTN